MKSRAFALLTLLSIAFLATGCGRYGQADAAVVNGHRITLDELKVGVAAAKAEERQQQQQQQQQQPAADDDASILARQRRVLVQLVQQVLLEEQLRREKLTVSERDVEARIAQIKQQFQSEAQFTDALKAQGLTLAVLRARLKGSLGVQRLQEKVVHVTVTGAELQAAYGAQRNQFQQAHVRHILFSSQSQPAADALRRARAALVRLRGGADFATLAKQLSDDTGSKASGGDLGFQPRGAYVPEFDAQVWSLKLNTVSEPVQTQFGYHLIEVLARRTTTFAQARAQLKTQLEQQKRDEAFQDYIQKIVSAATIEVNPRFGKINPATLQIVDEDFFTPPTPSPKPVSLTP
ncbi:MAG: peptidylprolyl isomerase [Actinomycetota bacterium]|nr:peptidylprolyl isomerase [Actinomycetota bacterium]